MECPPWCLPRPIGLPPSAYTSGATWLVDADGALASARTQPSVYRRRGSAVIMDGRWHFAGKDGASAQPWPARVETRDTHCEGGESEKLSGCARCLEDGWGRDADVALRTVHSAHLYSCWSAHDDRTRRRSGLGARRRAGRVALYLDPIPVAFLTREYSDKKLRQRSTTRETVPCSVGAHTV